MGERARWAIVVMFASAMAWTESATVAYLRTWLDRVDPYQAAAVPATFGLGWAELVREAATLVMLLAVGGLAGRTWPMRLGYTLVAFGTWDILYYVFLRMMVGWPRALSDWDVLFLLPLPWWGPVVAPMTIAMMMIVIGTLLTQSGQPLRSVCAGPLAWGLSLCGAVLALFVFTADAIQAAGQGAQAILEVVPTQFNWPLFVLALALMSTPAGEMILQLRRQT